MKKVLYLFAFIFLAACSEETPIEIPANILSKEKMTAVLLDIHLMEATMNLNVATIESTGIYDNSSSADVFEKNQITKAQYDSSFIFYTQNPELLSGVYEEVLNEFSKMQAKVANEK